MDEIDLLSAEAANLHGLLSLQKPSLKDDLALGQACGNRCMIELQSLAYNFETRSLHVRAYPDPGLTLRGVRRSSANSCAKAHLLLAEAIEVEIFFPESHSDPPLCYGTTDAAAFVAGRVNEKLLPLQRSSLVHAVSVITSVLRNQVDHVWPTPQDVRRHFATSTAQQLQDLQIRSATDLRLALLSMCKARSSAVHLPVPRFFYSDGCLQDSALQTAVAAIPPLDSLLDPDCRAMRSLPLEACVLLHHLMFRERVRVSEADLASDGELASQLQAGVLSLPPADRPSVIFKVHQQPDAKFISLAQKHGTRMGFHGSAPENFFSIVCLGLKNLTGTKSMRNGAAFGEGVYLAGVLDVARSFATWGVKTWQHTRFAAPSTGRETRFGYQVVAVCEFVDMPGYRRPPVLGARKSSKIDSQSASKDGSYYVVEDDRHLAVRALLLFKDPAVRWDSPQVPCGQKDVVGSGHIVLSVIVVVVAAFVAIVLWTVERFKRG